MASWVAFKAAAPHGRITTFNVHFFPPVACRVLQSVKTHELCSTDLALQQQSACARALHRVSGNLTDELVDIATLELSWLSSLPCLSWNMGKVMVTFDAIVDPFSPGPRHPSICENFKPQEGLLRDRSLWRLCPSYRSVQCVSVLASVFQTLAPSHFVLVG